MDRLSILFRRSFSVDYLHASCHKRNSIVTVFAVVLPVHTASRPRLQVDDTFGLD
jgi:hypothetical protein